VDYEGVRELLASTHLFPGSYVIKAIGRAQEDFVGRVVGAAQESLARAADVHYSVRSTPHGRHVAVTLDLTVLTPEEVLGVYQALRLIKGLTLLL
jgi:putative lipoic acid-binding regulatory protein